MYMWDWDARRVMDALVDWMYSVFVGVIGALLGNVGIEHDMLKKSLPRWAAMENKQTRAELCNALAQLPESSAGVFMRTIFSA